MKRPQGAKRPAPCSKAGAGRPAHEKIGSDDGVEQSVERPANSGSRSERKRGGTQGGVPAAR